MTGEALGAGVGWVMGELERLTAALHALRAHPDFEYATTENGRKDGTNAPPQEHAGWEVNVAYRGGFERFNYHEENYWRRLAVVDGADTEAAQ